MLLVLRLFLLVIAAGDNILGLCDDFRPPDRPQKKHRVIMIAQTLLF